MLKGQKKLFLEPLWYGGGQEKDVRPGTSNVPGIVGFGEACHLCSIACDEGKRIMSYRNEFEERVKNKLPNVTFNGSGADRLPNTSSISFPSVDADALIFNAQKIMIGTGSACNSGAIEPSHVLSAIGVSREVANSTVRVSFGRFNREIRCKSCCG